MLLYFTDIRFLYSVFTCFIPNQSFCHIRISYSLLVFYVFGFVENVSYYTGQNGKPNGDNSADKRWESWHADMKDCMCRSYNFIIKNEVMLFLQHGQMWRIWLIAWKRYVLNTEYMSIISNFTDKTEVSNLSETN